MRTFLEILTEMRSEDVQLGGEEGHRDADRLLVEAVRAAAELSQWPLRSMLQSLADAYENVPEKWYA